MLNSREALIISTGNYQDKRLQALRSPARDAEDLARVLADPEIGGYAVTKLIDANSHTLKRKITDLFRDRQRDDSLLLHLSCHGIKDDRGELFFAASDTNKDYLNVDGISAEFVRGEMRKCRARTVVLLLDCCYSGAFIDGTRGDTEVHVVDAFSGSGHGRAVITATNRVEYAWEGDHSSSLGPAASKFTGAVFTGLLTGDADTDKDGYISVTNLYDYVLEKLREEGAKQTPQRSENSQSHMLIARSKHGRDSPGGTTLRQEDSSSQPARPERRRVVHSQQPSSIVGLHEQRALDTYQRAEDLARSLAEPEARAFSMVEVAQELAPLSPRRSASLLDAAEREIVSALPGRARDHALVRFSSLVHREDPGRVMRLTNSVQADGIYIATIFSDVASVTFAEDRKYAYSLFEQAERIAREIRNVSGFTATEQMRAKVESQVALGYIAEKIATVDFERGVRLAIDTANNEENFGERLQKAFYAFQEGDESHPLIDIVKQRAATDLYSALQVANGIKVRATKVIAYAEIAGVVADFDTTRSSDLFLKAQEMARLIVNPSARGEVLGCIVKNMAGTDPEGALRLVDKIKSIDRVFALTHAVEGLAAIAPERAIQMSSSITRSDGRATVLAKAAEAYAPQNPDYAARLFWQAEQALGEPTKQDVTHQLSYLQLRAASALTLCDPAYVETLADRAENGTQKVEILVRMATEWRKAAEEDSR